MNNAITIETAENKEFEIPYGETLTVEYKPTNAKTPLSVTGTFAGMDRMVDHIRIAKETHEFVLIYIPSITDIKVSSKSTEKIDDKTA